MTSARPDVLRETDSEAIRLARQLVRTARYGALATIDPESGGPFASRVAVATDLDGTPLILVSALSEHTRALRGDPRVGLLLGEPGKGDPLAHPRISLRCTAIEVPRASPGHARMLRRYLNRQPKAKLYASFADFTLVSLRIDKASLVGGFGKAYRLSAADILLDAAFAETLAEIEQQEIDHFNACMRHAIDAIAGETPDAGWSLTGIDQEGIDLARGDEVRRVLFARPLAQSANLRDSVTRLAEKARTG
jgi:putative heme iron utilization protein